MARLLLVEDDPSLRLLLTRLLRDAGHDVSETATGREGLDAASATGFDLVLLDLMLPDMSGEHVLESLLTSRPSARVMVVSSVTDSTRRLGVLEGGAVDFVTKPFANAELLARVRAHTDRRPADTSPKEPTWSTC